MARAISVSELYSKKRKLVEFKGKWLDSFGRPEFNNVWFIMAPSGSGKTTFVSMLCKELTKFGRVLYNSIEEGDSESLKLAFQRVGMEEVKRKLIILDKESLVDLRKRLDKHKSADIIVIDTIQHSDIRKTDYLALKRDYPNKMFIIISHMEGKKPEGRFAIFIRQDAGIKITIEGYVAFIVTRYGGQKPFIIWPEGAKQYHGLAYDSLVA